MHTIHTILLDPSFREVHGCIMHVDAIFFACGKREGYQALICHDISAGNASAIPPDDLHESGSCDVGGGLEDTGG